MASQRMNRISEDVYRELCDLLRTVKDPRVSELLSVVRAEVSNDLSYATVYVSAMEGEQKTQESVKGLKSAAGYLRRELGHRLHLRKVPELRFVADSSIRKGMEITQILSDLDTHQE